MTAKQKTVTYLSKPGAGDIAACVNAAALRAKELGVAQVVISTTTGRSALSMAKALETAGHRAEVIAVGYSAEYAAKWGGFDDKIKTEAEKLGVRFITGTHIFGGIDSAVGATSPGKLIASTYYTFGQGCKVAVEVAVMAADQGYVGVKKPVIALGGTAEGVDTALLLTPVCGSEFFKLRVHEVICMANGGGK